MKTPAPAFAWTSSGVEHNSSVRIPGVYRLLGGMEHTASKGVVRGAFDASNEKNRSVPAERTLNGRGLHPCMYTPVLAATRWLLLTGTTHRPSECAFEIKKPAARLPMGGKGTAYP